MRLTHCSSFLLMLRKELAISVDVGILSLAVLEDFVHVEVEDFVDDAAFI